MSDGRPPFLPHRAMGEITLNNDVEALMSSIKKSVPFMLDVFFLHVYFTINKVKIIESEKYSHDDDK